MPLIQNHCRPTKIVVNCTSSIPTEVKISDANFEFQFNLKDFMTDLTKIKNHQKGHVTKDY